MKKMILSLAIAFTTLSAFAGEENVNQKVLNAFRNEFTNASQVEWTVSDDYYKASFIYNDNYVFAYYNTDGELLGMTRYISTTDLPIHLQMNLKKKYNSYWVSDLFEVAKNDVTSYYITVENADTRIVLKSTGGSEWSVFKTAKKA
ncbi:MAG: hypothetical protein HOP10_14795 [Chitinophagaceae bacterium]|nr:hypothetical protein [Chitinophagaceae bacterium]